MSLQRIFEWDSGDEQIEIDVVVFSPESADNCYNWKENYANLNKDYFK